MPDGNRSVLAGGGVHFILQNVFTLACGGILGNSQRHVNRSHNTFVGRKRRPGGAM